MPPRIGTLLTTALTTGALACSLALAAPRPKPPTVTRTQRFLTPEEQRCSEIGAFAYAVAQARDAGVSLTETLARQRAVGRTFHTSPEVEATYDKTIRTIFAAQAFSPATIRQLIEVGCLDQLAPRVPSTPQGDWR